MEEVNSLYHSLAENFEVAQVSPPTFIDCHLDGESEIILVSKKKLGSVNNGYQTPMGKRPREQNLDLTGSPLKLDLSYDGLTATILNESQNWMKEEEAYECIPCEDAEDILQQHHSLGLKRSDLLPMWVICGEDDGRRRILMASYSQEGFFNRAVVFNLGLTDYEKLCIDEMKLQHSNIAKCNVDQVSSKVEGVFHIAGSRVRPSRCKETDDILKRQYTGTTQVHCEWEAVSLQYTVSATLKLAQDVIIGHFLSPCTTLWHSVCSLQGINNALVNIGAAGIASGKDWESISIRPYYVENESLGPDETLNDRLHHLIGTVEVYGSTWNRAKESKPHESYSTLTQMLQVMENTGLSRDFTYRLWDIIKDSTTVGEIISLLIFAITKIAKNNICPYIDPTNTTQIAKMINKVSYDPSQAASLVKYVKSNISRSLAFIGELGMTKTCKEYTSLFSLIDITLGYNDKLGLEGRLSKRTKEAINQTMHDMTVNSMNNVSIFDNSMADNTMRFNSSSIFADTLHDLTVDNSRKPKRRCFLDVNDDDDEDLYNPDMVDEEAICKEWKLKLKRIAQLHVCLEHLTQLQQSLNATSSDLIPIVSSLLNQYTHEKSSVKSVGQMFNDPVQSFSISVQRNIVEDRIKHKRATLYKITLTGQSTQYPKEVNNVVTKYICSQRPLFPPSIRDVTDDDLNATIGGLKYHTTKYLYLSNYMPPSITI